MEHRLGMKEDGALVEKNANISENLTFLSFE
jgi:hypothetical protein